MTERREMGQNEKSWELPLVSVITPAYNAERYLEEVIESLQAQDYPNVEHIVTDDGSKDGTLSVTKKYDGEIRWDLHENMDEARTVNKGFLMGRGEILASINADDPLPTEGLDDLLIRRFPLLPPDMLVEKLRGYDVLLLLSSFEPEWRTVAETAQAGKMADYLAAGRCILAYGPEYAENVRYLMRHGTGEVVTSSKPGALREAILALADDAARRRQLGERAYRFGKEHRDRAANGARLWRALSEAAASHPPHNPQAGKPRTLLPRVTLGVLDAARYLRRRIRSVLKGRQS